MVRIGSTYARRPVPDPEPLLLSFRVTRPWFPPVQSSVSQYTPHALGWPAILPLARPLLASINHFHPFVLNILIGVGSG